jgi:hypothetical protein
LNQDDPRLAQVRALRAEREAARVRAVSRARIGAIAGAVVLVAVAGMAFVAAIASLVAGSPTGAVVGLLVAAGAGLGGIGCAAVAVALRRPEDLRARGIPGKARFLGIGRGGLSIDVSGGAMRGNVAQFALNMEVEVEGRPTYEVVVKDFVPSASVPRLVPGTWFAVFVDPRRPKRVLVDWDASPRG